MIIINPGGPQVIVRSVCLYICSLWYLILIMSTRKTNGRAWWDFEHPISERALPGQEYLPKRRIYTPSIFRPHTHVCVHACVPDFVLLFYTDNLVGRGEDCDVTLSNGSLSRKHAQILVEKGSHGSWKDVQARQLDYYISKLTLRWIISIIIL